MPIFKTNHTPVIELFPVGTILWRGCNRQCTRLSDPRIERNTGPSGAYIRALISGHNLGIAEPLVNPHTGPGVRFGVITFLPGGIFPAEAIALRVTGHTQAGTAMFAAPLHGDVQQYYAFRKLTQLARDSYDAGMYTGTEAYLSHVASIPSPIPGVRVQSVWSGTGYDILRNV